MSDISRIEFEEWFAAGHGGVSLAHAEDYCNVTAQLAWQAWQAARSGLEAENADLKRFLHAAHAVAERRGQDIAGLEAKNAELKERLEAGIRLAKIGALIKTQDNRCTADPMFCVQQRRRMVGFDANYAERFCWHNTEDCEDTIFDDDPNFKEPEGKQWEKFGYVDEWETVMVAFTEDGCKEYLRQNGHNLSHPRIDVESFRRCPEMIQIRKWLLGLADIAMVRGES